MRTALLGLVLSASACVSSPGGGLELDPTYSEPGTPKITGLPAVSWLQGETLFVSLSWPYACEGKSPLCVGGNFTVIDLTCDGCTASDQYLAGDFTQSFHAVATTDDQITITAHLRFETGDVTTISQSVLGDHAVSLDAPCKLLDSNVIAHRDPATLVPLGALRDCTTPRQPDDLVVTVPTMVTARGSTRYADPATVTTDPGPATWRTTEPDGYNGPTHQIAILPTLPSDGATVTVTAALLPTGTGTASFEAPAVVAPSPAPQQIGPAL